MENNNLKFLRKLNNKTQSDIAKILNMTTGSYNQYELGNNEPNINTLCKLADLYNVSIDYLVGRNFNNEFGYLSENEITIISAFRKMTPELQIKTQGIIIRMLAEA